MESKKKVSSKGSPRSPLKELNSSSSSYSQSLETPSSKGCLGLLIPNSSSSTTSSSKATDRHTTLKSVPTRVRPTSSKGHPLKPPPPSKPKKKKKIHFCISRRTKSMGSGGDISRKIDHDSNTIDDDPGAHATPMRNVASTPPGEAYEERCVTTTTATTTPPIQASISPEIQIGGSASSSIISTTPACFAAGHLLSGVTDKRKCRPRGILAVAASAAGAGEDLGLRNSLVPTPAEASMHWLLSPCEEDQEGSASFSAQSPLMNKLYEEVERESFSCNSCLSSQNLISTPQSHSTSETDQRCLEFETAVGDPVDVLPLPGFSFQFSDSSTSLSNAGSHSGGRQTTSSPMRISWREGLASRIFEMEDEFDCCQWLSEDEEDQFKCSFGCGCEIKHKVESGMGIDGDPMLPVSLSEEPAAAIEQKKKMGSPPPMPINPCAESISTEGGGLLVASTDSDWALSYKNHLFKV